MYASNRSVIATIVVSVLVAACASSSASRPDLSSGSPTADVTGAVSSPSPSSGPSTPAAKPTEFVPPSPVCPAPSDEVEPPDVVARIGEGAPLTATRGSSTFTTCSTVATSDVPQPIAPPNGLAAHPGDMIALALPAGWRFLRWEGVDDTRLDGGTIFPPTDTLERPQQIEIPAGIRPGDYLGFYSLWIISADERVVGQLEIFIPVIVRVG